MTQTLLPIPLALTLNLKYWVNWLIPQYLLEILWTSPVVCSSLVKLVRLNSIQLCCHVIIASLAFWKVFTNSFYIWQIPIKSMSCGRKAQLMVIVWTALQLKEIGILWALGTAEWQVWPSVIVLLVIQGLTHALWVLLIFFALLSQHQHIWQLLVRKSGNLRPLL